MGKGINKDEQEQVMYNAVKELEAENPYEVIEKTELEINEFRISKEFVEKSSLIKLLNQLYFCKQFKHAAQYLNPEDKDVGKMCEILSNRDLIDFPGYFVKFDVERRINISEAKTKASEFVDLINLFAIPFVELFTSDDQISEAIRQTKKKNNLSVATRFYNNKQFIKKIDNEETI